MKVLDGTINSRARESRDTRDEGDASSPQPFGIEGDDEVSLPLIEVGEQRGVFLLQFFFSAHTGRIPMSGPIVTAIILRSLSDRGHGGVHLARTGRDSVWRFHRL